MHIASISEVRTENLLTRDALRQESFLDEGFILDKRIGVGQPKRVEDAKILVANTPMDTDKVKIYGARVRVDSMQKVNSCQGAIIIVLLHHFPLKR